MSLAMLALLVSLAGWPSTSGAVVPIDVNAADAQALAELPGVGPSKAEAIVAERSRKPFASVDDLLRVPGIGEATLGRLRDHIVVKGTAPQG